MGGGRGRPGAQGGTQRGGAGALRGRSAHRSLCFGHGDHAGLTRLHRGAQESGPRAVGPKQLAHSPFARRRVRSHVPPQA